MTELRATYRLQLGAGLRLRARRASSCPTCATSASRTCTCRRRSRRARARRTATTSSTRRAISERARRRGRVPRAGGAVREAGLGIVLDIVPNHMATDDANRYWADPELRAQFFDIDPETGRHRRFFDIDHLAGVRQEDPEVFEATHALALALVREGVVDGLRIDHPDGLADPAGYLRRLRDGGAEHVWVEKILDPGERAARLAGRGHGRLRVPQRRRGAVRRPGRRGAADRAVGEISGDARPFARVRAARPSSSRRATTFAPRGRAAARASPPSAPRRSERALRVAAGLPHLRRAVDRARWPTRTARRSREAGLPPSWRACCARGRAAATRSSRASSRPRRR